MNDIKPCPFCGSTRLKFAHHAVRGEESARTLGCIKCLKCGATGPYAKSGSYDYRNCGLSKSGLFAMQEEAVELWNNRQGGVVITDDLPLFQPP